MDHQDLTRMKTEYQDRKNRFIGQDAYSIFFKPYQFFVQQRQRAVLTLLKKGSIPPIQDKNILEIGCGGGGVLLEYLTFGGQPANMFGIDLLHDRLIEAHQKLPAVGITCADGQHLPFPDNSFNLVMQYTAFSSVLDNNIKNHMASEMLRVLRIGGAILWYDFWLNPTNPQTGGIRPEKIRALFPSCTYIFRKITLAPPIARRIVPFSWPLAQFLESFGIFNSHYLVLIRKNPL